MVTTLSSHGLHKTATKPLLDVAFLSHFGWAPKRAQHMKPTQWVEYNETENQKVKIRINKINFITNTQANKFKGKKKHL